MLLFCITTNLVMGPAEATRFNVQAILIIAWTINLTALCLPVMASSDVKNPALAPLNSSHIITTEPSYLAVVVVVDAVIVGKGMVPNSTTSNARSLVTMH